MKTLLRLLLILIAVMLAAGNAVAECDCKQPAYKDHIDFLTRYTACLEECFSTRIQHIQHDLKTAEQRISDQDAEIERLNLRIRNLENQGSSVKE